MAHFAEIDINGKVLRVVVACNQDIANNGGEQSNQAAQHFATVVPLSNDGVKWVQTSYSNSFRKHYASTNYTYDSLNFPYTKVAYYPPTWTFTITISNDSIHMPPINPFYWSRTGSNNHFFVQDLRYLSYDVKGIGRRSFTSSSLDPNIFTNYSIK